MTQSAYVCVILYVKHKKIPFLTVFTRPLLVTSQASSSATTYKIYLILLRRSKAFHLRQNPFEILHTSKTLGRGSFNPPPPPSLVPRWGMNLRVRPRVNKYITIIHRSGGG